MSAVAISSQIERVEAPTREFFTNNYVMHNKPVILTGVATRWKALTDWRPAYLKTVAGKSIVPVHFNDKGDFHRWYLYPSERVDRRITLSEFLDILLAEPPDRRYYMTEHELRLVSPALLKDVDFSDYLPNVKPFEPLLFLGRDTRMPLHYHGTTEGFLVQLYGSKKVKLYSPGQFSLLYPRSWYQPSPLFSRVNVSQPDLNEFPRFKEAVPLEFDLLPGEMLYIPVHWWHVTEVNGFQISVTHFWKAKLQCWTFPTPGFHVVARVILFQSRKALNRVSAKPKKPKASAY